jgi:tetratricopeptide (TPR) repeat protein
MGIFNLFKSKTNNNSEALEDYNNAYSSYGNGEYQESLRTLSWGFRKDVNFKPLYELSEKCLVKLGGQDEANLFRNARKNFNNFQPFNNLGTHFYSEGNYDLALPFLRKAVEIDSKNSDTVHDLAIVYARRFNIKEAIKVLENNSPQDDFWNYWFLTKLRILDNQTNGVENDINELFAVLNNEPDTDAVAIPLQKVNEVKETFERLSVVGRPENHIRDWHYIQYGNIILDFFEDSDEYVAGGRYVASWGSNESIKEIVTKLSIYLKQFGKTFERVLYLKDRNSKILGLVIGNELNIEAKEFDNEIDLKNSLIVGANSTDFDGFDELQKIKKGQILFALNHYWLDSAQISPDICGFMTQTYSFPWDGGGIRIVDMEADERKTEKIPPDTRQESVIAEVISKLDVERPDEDENLSFYLKHKEFLKGIGSKVNDDRYNFMIESPIVGSYFG